MHANRLPATAGLRWIAEAFLIFRVAPMRELLFGLAFLLALAITLSLPLVGFALVWLLVPALMIGPHAIARTAARGTLPTPDLLLSGFRENFRGQLQLGGFYLGGMAIVLAGSTLGDDGRFARAMLGIERLDLESLQSAETLNAVFIATVLQTALLAALWYAPLLVAWKGQGAMKAVFFSAAAGLINWRAFLVYGVAMTVLFAFVMTLALAAALLLVRSGAQSANTAAFAVLWTLLPIWFASSYLSYRDVFDAGEAVGETPGKSPTIAP
jgi:hypothetical protein